MKKLVVLSGAGMSQESGLKTFRDMGGLWEEYDVTEVASIDAWESNRSLVMEFYNQRRKQLFEVEPNAGHYGIAELEKWFEVSIITQNVDDLHERAGSSSVLHLHGELRKVRSTIDPELIYTMDSWELRIGDRCEMGSQLRPHIVWFGEPVPAMYEAIPVVQKADILVVIGSSLVVYPAASLVDYVNAGTPVFVVDPHQPETYMKNVNYIGEKAGTGVKILKEKLLNLIENEK